MSYLELYSKVYKSLEIVTPMLINCGKLCNSACCSENALGMMLFPGEEEYLNSLEHDFTITDSDYKVNEQATKLLFCNGTCNRSLRPLSCRIFPLFPFLRESGISIEYDPRAKGICPLLYEDIEEIHIRGLFRLKVLKAAYTLISNKDVEDFLKALTIELDEISRFRL